MASSSSAWARAASRSVTYPRASSSRTCTASHGSASVRKGASCCGVVSCARLVPVAVAEQRARGGGKVDAARQVALEPRSTSRSLRLERSASARSWSPGREQ